MKNPLISVIIPVYNVEKYLPRCLESIICQAYENIEIIIVNDGSTDNSENICQNYMKRDNRIKLINQKNSGAAVARNIGIDYANGEYIGFVDSDDIVCSDMYEKLLKNIIKTNADISICDFIETKQLNYTDETKSNNTKFNLQVYNTDEIVSKFLRINSYEQYFSVWNRLYKAELFENIRFTEGIINEDVDFSYKIFLSSKLVCVSKEPLYYYYVGNNSITRNKLTPKDLDLFISWDNVLNYAEINDKKNIESIKVNCARSRFTLLIKYAMYGCSNFDNFELIKKEMINYVRRNIYILLRCDGIDIKRKIAIVITVLNFNIIKFIFKPKLIKI